MDRLVLFLASLNQELLHHTLQDGLGKRRRCPYHSTAEREREREREIESESEKAREREGKRESERGRKREREREKKKNRKMEKVRGETEVSEIKMGGWGGRLGR